MVGLLLHRRVAYEPLCYFRSKQRQPDEKDQEGRDRYIAK